MYLEPKQNSDVELKFKLFVIWNRTAKIEAALFFFGPQQRNLILQTTGRSVIKLLYEESRGGTVQTGLFAPSPLLNMVKDQLFFHFFSYEGFPRRHSINANQKVVSYYWWNKQILCHSFYSSKSWECLLQSHPSSITSCWKSLFHLLTNGKAIRIRQCFRLLSMLQCLNVMSRDKRRTLNTRVFQKYSCRLYANTSPGIYSE